MRMVKPWKKLPTEAVEPLFILGNFQDPAEQDPEAPEQTQADSSLGSILPELS